MAKLSKKETAKALDKLGFTGPRNAGQAISRMPRQVRDEISHALEDGADWKAVKAICEKHGYKGLRPQNVTNYRKGAHQDWVKREERMEVIRRDSEATAQIVRHYVANGGSPAEAGLLAASEIMSQALVGLGPESMQILIADDPKALFGITRELARVAELLNKRSEAAAAAATPDAPPADTMTEEEKAAMVVKLVDQALFSKK
jgi:hypothetical protein